jgi:hypothetical protein
VTDQPLHEDALPIEGEGAMTIRHSQGEAQITIAVEALTSESLCIVAFQGDRAAAGYFRRWVSSPEVMDQFRHWVESPSRVPGHSRSCAVQPGCTCGGSTVCYTSAIGAKVHGPGCTCPPDAP